jgi:hypothetical protein
MNICMILVKMWCNTNDYMSPMKKSETWVLICVFIIMLSASVVNVLV